MEPPKVAVRDFWEEAACGEVYATGDSLEEKFEHHRRARYELEPYIGPFAGFDGTGLEILEVGVGMGADHLEWARSRPLRLVGVDFTARAVEWTDKRLRVGGFTPDVAVADAENLPFPGGTFDVVYSWGCLHHTTDTARAFAEVHRVLRPGGRAKIMIYHRPSIVGYLLWLKYGLAAGRPRTSLAELYAKHLESPGTKGYTLDEAHQLVRSFSTVAIRSQLAFADLLRGEVGQGHRSRGLDLAKRIWPRGLIKRFLPGHGLMVLIEATK